MSDAAGQWLAAPAGSDEVVMRISIGEDVEVSQEAREALETLIGEFEEAEVSGHGIFDGLGPILCPNATCNPYSCELNKCLPESRRQCLVDYRCKIASFA